MRKRRSEDRKSKAAAGADVLNAALGGSRGPMRRTRPSHSTTPVSDGQTTVGGSDSRVVVRTLADNGCILSCASSTPGTTHVGES